MTAKHFFNDPGHLVASALRSVVLTNPSVALDEESKIIYRRQGHAPQVSLISGGGSGHEPSFAAFVGQGLLTAAVAGTIFASPSAEQVRKCILKRVEGSKGVCVVVMNYTGDVLNFGMAVEKAKASGVKVEMVVVADDVGVGREKSGKVGRRGLAGTVLVQKITGALAATGAKIEEVYKVALLTSENIISVGASLSHVHVPGRSTPTKASDEDLAMDEIEIGMGIHNEPGSLRVRQALPELVKSMLAQLLDKEDKDRAFLPVSVDDQVVLLINNLGGVSVLELGGITAEVSGQLEKTYGIKPLRVLSGTYMTSLNGLGFSVTLLRIADTGLGPGKSMLDLLHAPAEATGWQPAVDSKMWEEQSHAPEGAIGSEEDEVKPSNLILDLKEAKDALTLGLGRLISAEPDVTNYDTIVGDGDCGIGLKRGAEAVLKLLEEAKLSNDAVVLVTKIAQAVENSMDGTSGALYAIFLNALAHGLRTESASSEAHMTPQIWAKALQMSLTSLGKYTPAQPGDRTLMDALYPFVEVLGRTGDKKRAAQAAKEGAEGTKGMKASLGRTVYIGGDGWKGVPDPGAYGLQELLEGICEGS
ncbi:MAG: hypothetical protein M1827_001425 [Pycnora praestabilis]|nr:MAG: hypothetical protein M1827_001425 [Pycnora praestabilis]